MEKERWWFFFGVEERWMEWESQGEEKMLMDFCTIFVRVYVK